MGPPDTNETAMVASMVSKLFEATQAWLGEDQAVVAAVVKLSPS